MGGRRGRKCTLAELRVLPCMGLHKGGDERVIGGLGEDALLIKNVEHTTRFLRNQSEVEQWPRKTTMKTLAMRSMVACESMPKLMKVHSIFSRLYSSCSRLNMWLLKNCCRRSFVKLMQS